MRFTVIDLLTGKEPDVETIALTEDWAKGLVYCDMEGFLVGEDGQVYLADECGNYVVAPVNRFEVTFNSDVVLIDMNENDLPELQCITCDWQGNFNELENGYCPDCGCSVEDCENETVMPLVRAKEYCMDKRLCCCIPDQTKLNDGCQKLAEYQIWMGDNPTPDDFTESCSEHLEEMLDDSVKFVVLRIPQAA